MLPLGCFPGYPAERYHADPGFGSGSIKDLVESPAAFAMSRILPVEVTEEMDFGTAFHMRLLEPHFYERYVVELEEDFNFATKAGKEAKAKAAAERELLVEDLIFLKPKAVATLRAMVAGLSVIEDRIGVNPFEEEGESECAHFWNEAEGIRGKALVDRKVNSFQWLLDIKTTKTSLDERSLSKHAAKFGWAVQAAWYKRGVARTCPGWEDSTFAFVVFQTVAPFSVRFMPVPPETLLVADALIDRAIEHHRELLRALSAQQRPRDPHSGILELRYPEWFRESVGV